MVRDYSRRQFIVGCGCASAGALVAGGAAASTEDRRAAQPETRWNRTYESAGNAEMNAIVPATDDDGFVLAGGTGDTEGDNDRAAWLAKIDAAGELVWEETYTRQSTTVATDIVQRGDGYLFAGFTGGGPDGGQDGFAISVDAEGSVDWERTFWNNPDSDDRVNAVARRREGGFVFAGETSRFGRAWLVAVNEDGDVRENEMISGGSEGRFNDVVRHPDGGYIVVGAGDNNTDDLQGWVTRVNDSFEQVWASGQFFRKSSDSGTNPYDDFNVFYGVTRESGGFTMVGANAFDPDDAERRGWLLKINKNGDKQWDRRFSDDRFNEFYSVAWDSDRLEYLIAGQTATTADGIDRRGYVLNVGLTGDRMWQRKYAGEESESSHFSDLYKAGDGGIVCAGGAAPSVGANPDGWSVKLGGAEVETPTATPTRTATPTPTEMPTQSPSPTPTGTPIGGGAPTDTEEPTDTSTATATSTPGGGGDGTDEPTSTDAETESGLPLSMIGVGLAIVALGAGGFLYNRFGRGDDDGDAPVAGPGAGTGGAATLTGGDASDDGADTTGDDGSEASSEPTPASEVVSDEELERAQTVVDKPDSGADEGAGETGAVADESADVDGDAAAGDTDGDAVGDGDGDGEAGTSEGGSGEAESSEESGDANGTESPRDGDDPTGDDDATEEDEATGSDSGDEATDE